jgi:hypothetical protein
MFGLRRKKDENIEEIGFDEENPEKLDLPMESGTKFEETLPPFDLDTLLGTKTQAEEMPEVKTEEVQEVEPVKTEPVQTGVDKIALEELSKKIEDENRNIDRRFKLITKSVNQLTLESKELIDLIKLYASMSGKFNEFIEEMHRLEERGWKFDKNIAALYKFRVGMALANMKKQSRNVEKICKKVGFTPSNIKTILDSSIEELVKSLNGKGIEERKTKR